MSRANPVPVMGFAALSGTGKTTLLGKLLPLLTARGLRVGMIKHAHHQFDVDHPGKDSYVLRKAGAEQMLIASKRRWALMVETPDTEHEPTLEYLLTQLDHSRLDVILVEGFKRDAIPKIELHRPALGYPLLYPHDEWICAIASDAPLSVTPPLPQLDLNQPEQIARFILDRLARQAQPLTSA